MLVNETAVDEASFRAAWDLDSPADGESTPMAEAGEKTAAEPAYRVIPVMWGNLANSPSAENEVLRLLDAEENVVCEVNFQEGGEWPTCANPDGASIWLTDLMAKDLNDGRLWKRSESGDANARHCRPTKVFDGRDVGSPGMLPPPVDARPVPSATSPPEERKTAEDESKGKDDRIDY